MQSSTEFSLKSDWINNVSLFVFFIVKFEALFSIFFNKFYTISRHLESLKCSHLCLIILLYCRAVMEWSDGHDVMLCREILYEDPFQFKKGSPNRGEVWSKIARALNSCTELNFNVKQRSVRERFTLLQVKYKETNRKDEAGSGTSRQVSELDQLLEDITEKEKDSEESRNVVNAKKDDQDREKAENIRKTAMERIGQTKKRQEEGEETVSNKRKRRSGDETIGYLREKSETERKVT